MLVDSIEMVKALFGVEFHSWNRNGDSVLVASGFGIGLAIMDELPEIEYMVDMDEYRNRLVDWEAIATIISISKPKRVFMCGCFMGDSPKIFEPFKKGVLEKIPLLIYLGNDKKPLRQFIDEARAG